MSPKTIHLLRLHIQCKQARIALTLLRGSCVESLEGLGVQGSGSSVWTFRAKRRPKAKPEGVVL